MGNCKAKVFMKYITCSADLFENHEMVIKEKFDLGEKSTMISIKSHQLNEETKTPIKLDNALERSRIFENSKVSKADFVRKTIGDIESKFEIIKVLGQGAFGKVYMVVDKRTKFIRAMKEVQKAINNSDENQKILDEFEILKELVNFI